LVLFIAVIADARNHEPGHLYETSIHKATHNIIMLPYVQDAGLLGKNIDKNTQKEPKVRWSRLYPVFWGALSEGRHFKPRLGNRVHTLSLWFAPDLPAHHSPMILLFGAVFPSCCQLVHVLRISIGKCGPCIPNTSSTEQYYCKSSACHILIYAADHTAH
jgi:hypothetical protein